MLKRGPDTVSAKAEGRPDESQAGMAGMWTRISHRAGSLRQAGWSPASSCQLPCLRHLCPFSGLTDVKFPLPSISQQLKGLLSWMLTEAGQNGSRVLWEDKCTMVRAQWLPVSELSLNSQVWLPLTLVSEKGTSVVCI